MSKSLSILQTIAKVARIVCKVLFILCIIGGVGSLIGLVAVLAIGPIAEEMGIPMEISVLGCLTGLISCVGEAVFFRLTERYCEHELEAGTPFTKEGARELLRLGVASMIISVVIAFLGGIALGVSEVLYAGSSDVDISVSVSIESGLFMLLLSAIFRYGAEIREQNETPVVDWDPVPQTPVREEAPAEETPMAEEKSEESPAEETLMAEEKPEETPMAEEKPEESPAEENTAR